MRQGLLNSLLVLIFVIVFVIIFLWPRIVHIVRSGEVGVKYLLFFGGTVIDQVYPEGFHAVFPWDEMYIYNVRVQTKLHEFDVLTNMGLPIHLQLAIRFHPERDTVGVLHQELGPNYIETVVIPQIESVLRKNIGHYTPEDIYVNKEGVLSKIIILAIEEAGQKYVRLDDIVIRRVDLPEQVREAIAIKLVEEQKYLAYDFIKLREEQEAERKRIEAEGIRDYQSIISQTINDQLIKWQGVQATLSLSESENAKIIVIGAGKEGLPIILGTDH